MLEDVTKVCQQESVHQQTRLFAVIPFESRGARLSFLYIELI